MQVYGPSQVHGAQGISAPHATRAAQPPAASAGAQVGDQLDISEAGRLAERIADLPAMRESRVAELREAISKGSYETQERLSTAVDRLLDEIA